MPAIAPIQAVLDHDLCIACGACVEVCPVSVVSPVFHPGRGAEEVAVTTPSACVDCAAPCGDVCPSIVTDFARLALEPDGVRRDGRVRSVLVAQAPGHCHNGVSSSGGVLRLLATAALEAGTPVLCLVAESTGPAERVRHEAGILRSLDELSRVPGSIYHSVSFTAAIPLLRALETPCLLIAIPCHLAGLLAYIDRYEPALRPKIGVTAGIICGWMYSHHALDAFAHFKGMSEPWTDAGYRGEDKVGRLKLIARSGVHSWSRREFGSLREMVDFRSSFATEANRLRCRVCEDHLNVLADISVGDAWLARTANSKSSVVVVRTQRGEALLAPHLASGRLLASEGSFGDLVESQSRDLIYATTASRLSAFLQDRGKSMPHFNYSDPIAPAGLGLRQQFLFGSEMLLRNLLRRRHYRIYRIGYMLTRMRMVLRFVIAQARQRRRQKP